MKPDSSLKKIVLINQVSGYLFIDIVNAFCLHYDKVVLFAGDVIPMDIALSAKVKVVKIAKYNKKNTYTRTLSWVLGFIQAVLLLNTRYRRYEVFTTSNPPTLNVLPLFCPNKISLLVYDVYPDGLVAGNFIQKSNLIYKIWERGNKRAFRKLQSLTTITPGMAKVLSSYIEIGKINVIPAWFNQSIAANKPDAKSNKFQIAYNLENKFLIVYSGNLGKGYDLESLVHLANSLKENSNIQIFIIGDGYKRDSIQKLIEELQLTNCLLLPYQPASLFVPMLHAMHIGVVSLEHGASQMAIPSKTYNILGAGKPVICLGSKDSDLAKMIEDTNSGMAFNSDSLQQLTEYITRLSSDKPYYKILCDNALLASKKFTCSNAKRMVNNHINSL